MNSLSIICCRSPLLDLVGCYTMRNIPSGLTSLTIYIYAFEGVSNLYAFLALCPLLEDLVISGSGSRPDDKICPPQPSVIPNLKRYSGPAFIAVALVPGRPVYSLLLESCWQETNNQDRVYQELTLLAQSIGPVTCFCPYYETCHTTTVSAIAELFPHLRTLQLALVDHPSSDSYDMDDDSIIRDLVDSQEPGKSLLSYRVCSILRSDQTYLTAVAMCLLGVHPPNSFWSYQTPSEPRNFAVQPHGRFPRDARSPRTTATSSGHQRSRGCCSTDERSNSWPPREKEDLFYIP